MDFIEIMKAAFDDELEKIAGFTRIGRRPFKVTTLLKKKADMTKMSGKAEVAKEVSKLRYVKPLAIAGGSVLAYDTARKAKRDWQTGRAMRLQSNY